MARLVFAGESDFPLLLTSPWILAQGRCEFSWDLRSERRTEYEGEPICRRPDHRGVIGRGIPHILFLDSQLACEQIWWSLRKARMNN